MAASFSANQYENAFISNKLQNWEDPKHFRERPKSLQGCPKIIASDRGHLLPEYRRSGTEWSKFVGTWELNKKLPGNNIHNATARSQSAYEKLEKEFAQSEKQLRRRIQKFGTLDEAIKLSTSGKPSSGKNNRKLRVNSEEDAAEIDQRSQVDEEKIEISSDATTSYLKMVAAF